MKEKSRNLILILFLGIFSVALISTVKYQSQQKEVSKVRHNFKYEFSGKIKVVDGDSITVGDKEVRLIGIDAPEFHQNCSDANNQTYSCGKISKAFLIMIAQDKEAKCLYNQKDIYNRFLGQCFIDDLVINNEILKNGMAVIYDFTIASADEIALENYAKEEKFGIWQGSFQLPKDYRKTQYRRK